MANFALPKNLNRGFKSLATLSAGLSAAVALSAGAAQATTTTPGLSLSTPAPNLAPAASQNLTQTILGQDLSAGGTNSTPIQPPADTHHSTPTSNQTKSATQQSATSLTQPSETPAPIDASTSTPQELAKYFGNPNLANPKIGSDISITLTKNSPPITIHISKVCDPNSRPILVTQVVSTGTAKGIAGDADGLVYCKVDDFANSEIQDAMGDMGDKLSSANFIQILATGKPASNDSLLNFVSTVYPKKTTVVLEQDGTAIVISADKKIAHLDTETTGKVKLVVAKIEPLEVGRDTAASTEKTSAQVYTSDQSPKSEVEQLAAVKPGPANPPVAARNWAVPPLLAARTPAPIRVAADGTMAIANATTGRDQVITAKSMVPQNAAASVVAQQDAAPDAASLAVMHTEAGAPLATAQVAQAAVEAPLDLKALKLGSIGDREPGMFAPNNSIVAALTGGRPHAFADDYSYTAGGEQVPNSIFNLNAPRKDLPGTEFARQFQGYMSDLWEKYNKEIDYNRKVSTFAMARPDAAALAAQAAKASGSALDLRAPTVVQRQSKGKIGLAVARVASKPRALVLGSEKPITTAPLPVQQVAGAVPAPVQPTQASAKNANTTAPLAAAGAAKDSAKAVVPPQEHMKMPNILKGILIVVATVGSAVLLIALGQLFKGGNGGSLPPGGSPAGEGLFRRRRSYINSSGARNLGLGEHEPGQPTAMSTPTPVAAAQHAIAQAPATPAAQERLHALAAQVATQPAPSAPVETNWRGAGAEATQRNQVLAMIDEHAETLANKDQAKFNFALNAVSKILQNAGDDAGLAERAWSVRAKLVRARTAAIGLRAA